MTFATASTILWLVQTLLAVVTLVTLVRTPARRLGYGRHVSRPLIRRIGRVGVLLFQMGLCLVGIALMVAATAIVPFVVIPLELWILDDCLTGDDDDRRRRRSLEWAKVKIQMPAPVKLRLVDRWAPSPAA